MSMHHYSNISGYSGLFAVLSSLTMTEALQHASLIVGLIFLFLGCILRVMEIAERRKRKEDSD